MPCLHISPVLQVTMRLYVLLFLTVGENAVMGHMKALEVPYIDCSYNLCISKCCPPGSHFSLSSVAFGCVPLENSSLALDLVFKAPNGSDVLVNRTIRYIVQFLLCKLYDFEDIHLLPNGSLFLPTTGELIRKDQYCLDMFETPDSISLGGSICSQTLTPSFTERFRRLVNPFSLLISCIFLAATFICHVIIPKLRDMQGLCFMSYVAALFIAFLLLCVNLLLPEKFSNYGCVGIAILNQYFLLTSFFWLNVMCFDIWTVIRNTMNVVPMEVIRINNKRKFIIYSLYAWGAPLLVSFVTLVLHIIPEEAVPDYVVKPQLRKVKCWFPNDIKVLFAYYYGIVAFLLFASTGFIIHTSIMLFKVGIAFNCCKVREVIGESDNRSGNTLLLSMFWHRFCLFSLMTLNWTTEVLSFIPPEEMWILTDILNTLQGFFVFILFIRNTTKIRMLVESWKKLANFVRTKRRKQSQRQNLEMSRFIARAND